MNEDKIIKKIVELEARIVELENLTIVGKGKPQRKKEKMVRVSGVPYKVNVEDIPGGGN